ncbi:hypothetical protein OAS39_10040 [Pirellulales bacterium]|nr:hypothetical protein [Pirellulales bacterium]
MSVQRSPGGQGWVLVHPRCTRDRAEDLDVVRQMIDAGETDIAIDELRWLLHDCSEMIEAHYLLGKLAVEVDNDIPLARGHFGFGFQAGALALRRAKNPTPVPTLHPANRAFYDAGRGLAWALHALDKSPMALEVLRQLLASDPTDPLGLAEWVDEIGSQGLPIVEL